MKPFKSSLKLSGFPLLALVVCNTTQAQQPPDNIEGNWTIYSHRIQDGAIEVKHIQIQQYGNRLTGYFEGPYQQGPIQGRVDVHHVQFQTLTNKVLNFRGQIYGDSMAGMYGLHGKHAAWQASFRILTAQGSKAAGGAKQYIVNGKMIGGFAVIATPVKYRDSGVMTFIISQLGIVFQRDLGMDTAKLAAAIEEYNPTSFWKPLI
jgi:hypothetical protein